MKKNKVDKQKTLPTFKPLNIKPAKPFKPFPPTTLFPFLITLAYFSIVFF
jgi:hypothetical protein